MLSPEFKEELCKVARVMQPFVHWSVSSFSRLRWWLIEFWVCSLNDLMTLPNVDSSDSSDGEEDDEEDANDEE